MLTDSAIINDEIDSIVASGVLGRSPVYSRLLRYLAAATMQQKTASEVDIATDVLRKGGEFDSNQDSSVRVYVHNLRQRLDRYYEENDDQDGRLWIPKGEYRIDFTSDERTQDSIKEKPSRISTVLYVVAALLVCNLLLLAAIYSTDRTQTTEISQSPIWAPILESERPLLVVVGDYFIVGEMDEYGRVARMVREFNINSPSDLTAMQDQEVANTDKYVNLNLSYLPQSMGFALTGLLSVVHARAEKHVSVIPASQLRTSDLKSNDVLYVGYLSGLGILESYVFSASEFEIGSTYDELLHRESGRYYLSDAGLPNKKTYQDFALLTLFPGAGAENHVMVAAGTRDAGLMFIAEALSSSESVRELSERMEKGAGQPYEALYRVVGSDRTSLDATLIHDAILSEPEIWDQNSSVN